MLRTGGWGQEHTTCPERGTSFWSIPPANDGATTDPGKRSFEAILTSAMRHLQSSADPKRSLSECCKMWKYFKLRSATLIITGWRSMQKLWSWLLCNLRDKPCMCEKRGPEVPDS